LIFRAQPGPRQRKSQPTKEYKPSAVQPGALPQKPKGVIGKKKIGRNDPCPCGSGKKYKKCCGKNVA